MHYHIRYGIIVLMLVALLGSSTTLSTARATAPNAGHTSNTTILYQNNFEAPSIPPGNFCASDFSQTPVNSMYGPGFQQVWTPELMIVNGPQMRYSDPSGIGGNYVLGMLENLQDDKLALTFDSQMRSFINIGIDISAISADGCGVTQAPSEPRFRLSLYDTPSGVFSFNDPGTLLSSIDIAGTAVPQQFVFDWTHHVVSLNAAASTNGTVTLMWDVVGGFYAAFDNLVVTASDTPGVGDNDFDGIPDDVDPDDDNDDVPDGDDPFPQIPDTTPPSIIVATTPFELWPPNHQYETFAVSSFVLGATDDSDGQLDVADVVIRRVTSDELEDAPGGGDGETLQDIVIAADGRSVQVRSERQGSGNGRVYTVYVEVRDRSGNSTTASFQLHVPKSQNGKAAVEDRPVYTVNRQ